ncbi:hypothetical protein BJY04DRAFT_101819 [Aspergillus karnatakaensis]|uniref:DUF5572 domain-containing protein n=1 Tax=Aspergillus karnatakaensis TaxID=1810916 RepID=UPI003CCE330B
MNPTSEAEISSPPPRESTPHAQTPGSQLIDVQIYHQLSVYPFETDPEFAAGLAIILGHPETPALKEELVRDDDLVLQAKCYYFARKEKLTSPLNVATYKLWLEARHSSEHQKLGSQSPKTGSATVSLPPISGDTGQQATPICGEPAYPTSFAHIVELITTGQQIPGIQQIPDTLLTGQGTESEKPRRLKPWEKGTAT